MVCGHQVIVVTVAESSEEGVLVGAGGESGEVFADLQTADGCGDGLKLAADFERRIRFHIEGVVVADGTGAEHEDQRFGAWGGRFRVGGSRGAREKLAETAADRGGTADLQQVSAGVLQE